MGALSILTDLFMLRRNIPVLPTGGEVLTEYITKL